MLKNAMGASPFSLTLPYASSLTVFAKPTTPQSTLKVSIDGFGVAEQQSNQLSGIFVMPNQNIEVEIVGGGEVFCSIIEENLKLLGGVAIASVEYEADGQTLEFDLPASLKPANAKAEVNVFLDGISIDFDLSIDKDKVTLAKPPYAEGKLKITLTKPQES